MIFLRPWFLILILLLPLLYYSKKKWGYKNPWKKFINPEFIPFLMVFKSEGKAHKHSFLWVAILWSLLTIALAGPAWQKMPTDTGKNIAGTVLIADLNSVNQTTLPQLKIKLSELLKKLNGEQVGLVLYDKKGYIALPMTEDLEIIQEMIPALNPTVLPDFGNHPEEGFKKAIELFQNNKLQTGRILFLTGGIPSVDNARQVLKNSNYKVGILGLGFPNKKMPVLDSFGTFQRDEKGNPILVSPDKSILEKLGHFTFWTPDNQDIETLLNQTKTQPVSSFFSQAKNNLLKVDTHKDMGVYLLILLLPFVALFFRKGVFVLLIILIYTEPATANPWLREDQILHKTNQKAIQAYQKKDYLSALAGFQNDSSLTGLYNQGNAQAHLGNFDEAIQLYTNVLKQNPQHKEAKFNKDYLEKIMKEKNNPQNQNQDKNDKSEQEKENSTSKKNDLDNSQNQSDTEQDKNPKQSDSQNNNNLNTSSQNNSDEKESQSENQKNSTEEEKQNQEEQIYPPKENSQENTNKQSQNKEKKSASSIETEHPNQQEKKASEFDQETQEIFNKLKKDPSRLLKYRLYEQMRRTL